jgi:hypothetical protein
MSPQAQWAGSWPGGEALSPSPADRARAALLDDPSRSNAEIAISIRVRPQTVQGVRRSLEDLGVIAVSRVARRNPPEHVPTARQPRVLMQGTCVGHAQPGLWTSDDAGERNVAVTICTACHVQRECLAWALANLPAHDQAIWAGTNASQRTRMRRERGLGVPGPRGQPWINLVKINCNTCGLPLSGPNLYEYQTPDGRTRRACRACRRRRTNEWQRARRAAARESQESALARCPAVLATARTALTCADAGDGNGMGTP